MDIYIRERKKQLCMKIENILLVGGIIAAAAYILPKVINAETNAEKSNQNVSTRQENMTTRTEVRWETASGMWDKLIDSIGKKTETNKSKPSSVGQKTYTTIFSPKQIQDAAVKLSKPNPYTSVGYIAPTAKKPATAIKPNLKMTAMVNKLFLATVPTKNKPQVKA